MEIHFSFSQNCWKFPIEISLTTSTKTHFHSFPHRFWCNRSEIATENRKNMLDSGKTLIRKNFHYCFFFALSLSLSSFTSWTFFLSGDCCGSVFCFVSCKSSSSLSTELVRWKNEIFRNFFSARSLSFSLLTGDWWFFPLLIVVGFLYFVVCAAFDANNKKKDEKCEKIFLFYRPKFSSWRLRIWWLSLTSRGVN